MAFKMRCPKCFGLDYSIERDNRTFGAVAQAFELVFHCRCGKQMFGEVLLKEYERQKREFESGGEISGEPDPRARDLERLRQDADKSGRRADADAGDSDDEPAESDEDEPKEDKRWRQRMAALAADDDDDDDDDDTPSPAPSRSRAKKAAPASKVSDPEPASPGEAEEVAAPDEEDAAPKKPARAPRAKVAPKPKAEARPAAPPPEEEEDEEDDGELGEMDEESAEEEGADPTICMWPGCGKIRRPNSKYCSRACSNKNARSRHKQRGRRPSRGKAATAEA